MMKKKPTGQEIAEKSRGIRLNNDRAILGKKNGKKVKFTPSTHQFKSLEELENGVAVGELENELEGDETGLPPGKHNIFVAKVDGEWRGYAESKGKIVAEAARVSVERRPGEDIKIADASTFNPDGWCWGYCLCGCFGYCFWYIGVCW